MNPEPNAEKSIFEAAVQYPPEQRTGFVERACGRDVRLRNRVEALLQAHEQAGPFLERPSVAGSVKDLLLAAATVSVTEKPGDRIGRYKLLEKIGEGGWGVVYMAEQEEPLRRKVAVKIIKLGMDSKSVIARFEAERQALALMDHPNIAKVLDAGTTDTGRPFFVMELVHGIRITDYCDQKQLSTEERLALFMQVCHAIQHAHQKGIIHRDIKPSNILVTLHDGVPVSKVIDFGIAKAANQQPLTDHTIFTAFAQFLGTPAYMSPEQAEMSGLDIDTRSDIYSLGVLLYELLTGRTPFDSKELLAAGLESMRRTIREQEPPKPSTCLHAMRAAELTRTAEHRRLDPPRLLHKVRGDLDWIVMKTIEKDRRRRYPTANDLAADIQRHLNHEPVSAAAPGLLYRSTKFVRRHKAAFATAAALVALLVAGVVVSTWQAVRATRAEKLAQNEAMWATRAEKLAKDEFAREERTTRILETILMSLGPSADRRVMPEAILAAAAASFEDALKDRPDGGLSLRGYAGRAYWALGFYKEAEAIWRESLAVMRKLFPDGSPMVAAALDDLAIAIYSRGRLAEAEDLEREALEMRRKFLGQDHEEYAISLNNLALILRAEGKLDEAERLNREDLAISRRLSGNEHPDVAISLGNLGLVLLDAGKLAEAEATCREAMAVLGKTFGTEHQHVAIFLNSLALVLRDQGKLAEAETTARQALTIQRKAVPERDHPNTATFLDTLGVVLRDQNKLVAAEAAHREALAMQRRLPDSEYPDVAQSLSNLALVLRDQGKLAEMEPLIRECLAIREKHAPDDWRTFDARRLLGSACLRQNRPAEAEPLLLAAIEGLTQLQDRIPANSKGRLRAALQSLVELYETTAQPDKATEHKGRLVELDKAAAKKRGPAVNDAVR